MKPFLQKSLIFMAGAASTWCVIAITQPITGELRDDHVDAAILGTHYDFGEEARRAAAVAGIAIPRQAIDVFYGIQGLKPVVEFVAFTLPTKEVWPTVTALSGKQKSDAHELPFFRGPELLNNHYRTILFNTTGLAAKVGIRWEIKERLLATCIPDEASGRIFIFISPIE